MMRTDLKRQLYGDEGKRTTAYKDSLGYLTIGVGRLIDASKPGAGLRDSEVEFLLNNDIDDRTTLLGRNLPWFLQLDDARQGVLLNMSFQLGVDGLLGFRNTLALVKDGRYADAANEMLDSKWARQTPERAKRLAEQMRTGVWQFSPGT